MSVQQYESQGLGGGADSEELLRQIEELKKRIAEVLYIYCLIGIVTHFSN